MALGHSRGWAATVAPAAPVLQVAALGGTGGPETFPLRQVIDPIGPGVPSCTAQGPLGRRRRAAPGRNISAASGDRPYWPRRPVVHRPRPARPTSSGCSRTAQWAVPQISIILGNALGSGVFADQTDLVVRGATNCSVGCAADLHHFGQCAGERCIRRSDRSGGAWARRRRGRRQEHVRVVGGADGDQRPGGPAKLLIDNRAAPPRPSSRTCPRRWRCRRRPASGRSGQATDRRHWAGAGGYLGQGGGTSTRAASARTAPPAPAVDLLPLGGRRWLPRTRRRHQHAGGLGADGTSCARRRPAAICCCWRCWPPSPWPTEHAEQAETEQSGCPSHFGCHLLLLAVLAAIALAD